MVHWMLVWREICKSVIQPALSLSIPSSTKFAQQQILALMSSSDVSSLSSAESLETDEELLSSSHRKGPLDQYFKNAKSSLAAPKSKRPASPPHEYVFEDNPDVAVSNLLNLLSLLVALQ